MAEKKSQFHLAIKTPTETIYDGDVNTLTVETETGRMVVLPHHASLIGVISFSNTLISSNEKLEEYSIRNGFINVDRDNNTCHIHCLTCEKTQTVKYTTIEQYLEFLKTELKTDNLNRYQLEFLENEHFAVVKQLKTIKK